MTQLHKVVAIQRAVGERTKRELTDLYRTAQHAPMYMGSVKEMVSKNDEDVPSEPPEVTLPPMTADKLIRRMETLLTEAWDLMATRDRSNMNATGAIVIGDRTLVEGVPLSTLLSLEKHLQNVRTIIESMTVRDPSKVWTFDADQGIHRAPTVRKPKTRKTIKGVTLYEATDQHPAQVQAVNQDEIVGHYVLTDFSGAFSAQEKETYLDRINTMIDAVRAARTEANTTEVVDLRIASELLGYLFAR